jgi:hypothetical protein
MEWNLEGLRVTGRYMGDFDRITGTVELSRVKYGGEVCHTVVLDEPMLIYGTWRDRAILEHKYVEQVSTAISA